MKIRSNNRSISQANTGINDIIRAEPELLTPTPQYTDDLTIGRVKSTAEDRQRQ